MAQRGVDKLLNKIKESMKEKKYYEGKLISAVMKRLIEK